MYDGFSKLACVVLYWSGRPFPSNLFAVLSYIGEPIVDEMINW